MKKDNLKLGFTLVELMVFFVFISLVLAVSAPIITKKVRQIPERVPHGKFVCKGGSWSLYNTSRLIASGWGCEFKPPKKTALFRIELVGAGAGGYELHEEVEDTWDDRDYDMALSAVSSACGVEGNGITCPPNPILRQALKGASFTVSTMSPSAFKGSDVTETYVGVAYPSISRGIDCWSPTAYTCTKTRMVQKDTGEKDEEGNTIYEEVEEEYQTTCYTTQEEDNATDMYTCSEIRSAISSIASDISSQKNCGSPDWCYTLATDDFIAPYINQVEWFKGTINGFNHPGLEGRGVGASGGYGTGLSVKGTIDFCDHHGLNAGRNGCPHGNTKDDRYIKDEQVREYLSKLFSSYYVAGTTQYAGGCTGWGYHEYEEFPDTAIDSSSYKRGAKGNEPRYYGAIKTWESCVTNIDHPTGGEGGWLRVNESSIYGTSTNSSQLQPGKDATDMLVGFSEGPYRVENEYYPQSIPSLHVYTKLSGRKHTVGQGGSAAETPVVRYVTQLDDDCVFDVASGGAKIKEGVTANMIEKLEEGLDTHLTCNGGTLKLTAEGGSYNPSSYTQEYSGFSLIHSDGSKKSGISSLETVDPGGISPYIPNDVFSKILFEDANFGAGGRGDTITDFCTMPQGEYKVSRMRDGVAEETIQRTIDRTTGQQDSCAKTNIRRSDASSGSAGVIIISW